MSTNVTESFLHRKWLLIFVLIYTNSFDEKRSNAINCQLATIFERYADKLAIILPIFPSNLYLYSILSLPK